MPGKASYTKRQDQEATVFETKPAPCPKYWFVLILGVLMAFLSASSGMGGFIGLIMWGLVILAIVAFFRDPRPKSQRGPAKLRVTPADLVSTTGKTYRADEIREISLQNLYSEGGSGAGISVGGQRGDLGLKRKQKMRAVSWYLQLDRADGETFNIAGGLDRETAQNLQRDICDITVPKGKLVSEARPAG